jgi:hypothetical protein
MSEIKTAVPSDCLISYEDSLMMYDVLNNCCQLLRHGIAQKMSTLTCPNTTNIAVLDSYYLQKVNTRSKNTFENWCLTPSVEIEMEFSQDKLSDFERRIPFDRDRNIVSVSKLDANDIGQFASIFMFCDNITENVSNEEVHSCIIGWYKLHNGIREFWLNKNYEPLAMTLFKNNNYSPPGIEGFTSSNIFPGFKVCVFRD